MFFSSIAIEIGNENVIWVDYDIVLITGMLCDFVIIIEPSLNMIANIQF